MRDLQLQKFHYVLIFHTFLHVVSASVWKFMLLQNDMWLLIIFFVFNKGVQSIARFKLGDLRLTSSIYVMIDAETVS